MGVLARLGAWLRRRLARRSQHTPTEDRIERSAEEPSPPAVPRKPRTKRGSPSKPLHINLGIDFGTRFSKICFRDIGADFTRVVTLQGKTLDGALVHSAVAIDSAGSLTLPNRKSDHLNGTVLRYLKMRLAGEQFGSALPTVAGHDLNNDEVLRTITAWYLATLIAKAKKWIGDNERDRLKGRSVSWSANVCVPVEHCDSPMIDVYREILAAAWHMTGSDGRVVPDLGSALTAYRSTRDRADRDAVDCHPVPEILAALQSFVISRSARADRYIYFDIGGGTIDGVAFRLNFDEGASRVAFYASRIDHLGVDMLARNLQMEDSTSLAAELERKADQQTAKQFAERIHGMVASVIMAAKKKDTTDWQVRAETRKSVGPLLPHQMKPLTVFVGGGGARIPWYRKQIEDTYRLYNHHMVGIPPYRLLEVPKPSDLDMTGIPETEFGRFAVAYGLSIPMGEGPDVRLPSMVQANPAAPMRRPLGGVDYENSKDAFD